MEQPNTPPPGASPFPWCTIFSESDALRYEDLPLLTMADVQDDLRRLGETSAPHGDQTPMHADQAAELRSLALLLQAQHGAAPDDAKGLAARVLAGGVWLERVVGETDEMQKRAAALAASIEHISGRTADVAEHVAEQA